jgi:mono/diheme cytochrome c family protein
MTLPQLRVIAVALLTVGALSIAPASGQDAKKIEAGESVYSMYCETCHGSNMVSSGQNFDLRKLRKDERPRFENSVMNGKNQMPPWKGVLNADHLEVLWAFIRSNANDR